MAIEKLTLDQKEKIPKHQVLMLVSYVVVLVNVGLAWFFYYRLQPQIPLFYSLAEPAAQLTNKEWIFLTPAGGLALAVLHSLIIALSRKYDQFIWYLLALVTLVFELILLAINCRIIWLVS